MTRLRAARALFIACFLLSVVINSACQRLPEQAARPRPTPPGSGGRAESLCRDPEYGQSPLPPPEGFVNDFAEVIDDDKEALLEKRLEDLKGRAGVEIAVVTVSRTGGVSVFDYSLAVACGWGVGPKEGEGGGVVLLVSVEDGKYHIQVGRSLEGDLPNETVAEIGRSMHEPFRRNHYGEGIERCVEGIIKRLTERGRVKSS